MKVIVPVVLMCLLVGACGKEKKFEYSLTGVVKNARTFEPLPGLEISISQQEVSGGTFNQNFNLLANTITDGAGTYNLEFPRENAVAYRVETSASPYIPRTFEFDQSDFEIDVPKEFDFSVYPEAFIDVFLQNESPSSVSDIYRFRFDQVDFDCQCCNGNWKVFEGAATDTSFSCRLYGDTWLHYVTHLTTPDLDTLIADSLWCPAFQTTQLQLEY